MTCEKFAEPPLVIQIARTGLGTRLVGPLFFNIFISDLFYHITEVKLHAYADDENYMTHTLTLNYLTGGSCISQILQTNGTEATVCWSIPPNTRP